LVGTNDLRVLRQRQTALANAIDRQLRGPSSYGAPRCAVQIYNGGSMPSSTGKFFLANPVTFTGTETEGGTDVGTVDTSTSLYVLVLGSQVPSVGDILTAYAVGGRWVAERGAGSGGGALSCSPCAIPEEDLTLSWVNDLLGNGETTLTYTSTGGNKSWLSDCANGLLYQLYCTSGSIELRVIFFITGECPDGSGAYCSNLRETPFSLTLSSYTCSPFSLTFTVANSGCPAVSGIGYHEFIINK
jgi:hypothetical protein